MSSSPTADDIIALLDLSPHPEGGWYRQTWVGLESPRASGTCIYFLLKEGEQSHWHRVDAAEIWHYYAGAPIKLVISEDSAGPAKAHELGPGLEKGQRPQFIVPAGAWQSATSLGDWTLVGCTVSPGFEFAGFELAAPEFDIPLQD
ncbi:MAG: cupin domain-containing protein [Boseongicola sp.]|nr:cupin domain-containing protein [Boseongicola sp.]MDD9978036.1 cupin domain-containing protein [Boseongicola sp.]